MGLSYPLVSDQRVIRAFDIAVALWMVIWLAISVVTFLEVRSLRQLSDTLVSSSDVLADTADVLASVEDVPILGGEVADVQGSVKAAAESARTSGEQSRDNINDLSVLLGIVIFLVPVVPVMFLYLPLRVAWKRESNAVAAALATSGNDHTFKEFLARRAVQNLGVDRLQDLGINPWRALEAEQYDELSRVELDRLGISERPGRQ